MKRDFATHAKIESDANGTIKLTPDERAFVQEVAGLLAPVLQAASHNGKPVKTEADWLLQFSVTPNRASAFAHLPDIHRSHMEAAHPGAIDRKPEALRLNGETPAGVAAFALAAAHVDILAPARHVREDALMQIAQRALYEAAVQIKAPIARAQPAAPAVA